jgi:hypothetical protein
MLAVPMAKLPAMALKVYNTWQLISLYGYSFEFFSPHQAKGASILTL